MKDDDLHNGISMHRIRVGGGVAGFIVVAGFLCIGLVGIPMLRYFLGFAILVETLLFVGGEAIGAPPLPKNNQRRSPVYIFEL